MPPTSSDGSQPACVSTHATMLVVVVLPCVPGDDDGMAIPEELVPNPFGQRAVALPSGQHRLEFDVAARDGVTDYHHVCRRVDVRRVVSLEHLDVLGPQEVAHRRIDAGIRAGDAMAAPLQHRGKRRHRRAGHANQVNVHVCVPRQATAASSIESDTSSAACRRDSHAERQVIIAPACARSARRTRSVPSKPSSA